MRLFLAAFLFSLSAKAAAQGVSAASVAARAVADLDAATQTLAGAEEADDRIEALTSAILAFETGLSALRDAHRRAIFETEAATERLEAASGDLSSLLAALQAVERPEAPLRLAHPQGPLGSARAAMLLGGVLGPLQSDAAGLAAELEALQIGRTLRDDARARIDAALLVLRQTREDLVEAARSRSDLPLRLTEDTERLGALLNGAETLAAFADGLSPLDETGSDPVFLPGEVPLALPVQGVVVRGAGAPDRNGVVRPGVSLGARPQALVTTPAAATVRFTGPLLDYGNVMILEFAPGYLMVLGGLGEIVVSPGQVLPLGAPVGLMPQTDAGAAGTLVADEGREFSMTLYVETRQGAEAVDPAKWFTLNKE
ncbi:MAG: peptidoglycan DD-metalloendopeptidase family protein [Pseudomonadota bacterium]